MMIGVIILVGLDLFLYVIFFYCQMLQWFGGMGIIVLVVVILFIFGVGGMQFYCVEMFGLLKDNKMCLCIVEMVKILWFIYVLFMIVCVLVFWFVGMLVFDVIGYSFVIIVIGGFLIYDVSVGYFNSLMINFIIVIFLLIFGCNYGLYFLLLSGCSLKVYWCDFEFRMFIGVQLMLVIVCMLVLWFYNVYGLVLMMLNQVFFQVVLMVIIVGFIIDSIVCWLLFFLVLLLCFVFIGGCVGFMGGGLKVICILLLFKQGNCELKCLVYLNVVYSIKLGNCVLLECILEVVWGFFFVYVLVFIISMLVIIVIGVDDFFVFVFVVVILNNFGSGFGVVVDNFVIMNLVVKWILIVNMLFGCLEVFILLVFFIFIFWCE